MKGNCFSLIFSLQLEKFISLPFCVNSLSQRATLRMDIQIFQLSQGHSGRQGISYWVGRRWMDRVLAFVFSEVMDVIHLPAVSLCMSCFFGLLGFSFVLKDFFLCQSHDLFSSLIQ